MKDCKRLIEVDFPIAEVSLHAAREKSIRRGHPSTLHVWWARRPLAACRAVLLGLLLPDPCDSRCPQSFRETARALLAGIEEPARTQLELQKSLLTFLADFADWDNSSNPGYVRTARALIRAAYGDQPPLVVDPFAGGGSIPLEALRLGCESFASDLNPVACLMLKLLLEEFPRDGPKIAEVVRRIGTTVKAKAEAELAAFYPIDLDGAHPIAYLWARTVLCEAPNCGAEIPLVRSFWLLNKAVRGKALRYEVERGGGKPPQVIFEIFEPKKAREVPKGTVARGNATCPACSAVLRVDRVRIQLSSQRGGADPVFDGHGRRIAGARLLAVVTTRPGDNKRQFRLPTDRDYTAVVGAVQALTKRADERSSGFSLLPDEPLPPAGTLGFRVQKYGMRTWGDLFTARQKLALVVLTSTIRGLPESMPEAARQLLALSVSRFSDDFSSLVRWMDRGTPAATFTRQALPILWDFCELWPFDNASWSFTGSLEWVATSAESTLGGNAGQVQLADATSHPLPDETATIWFTDPPYYDAVPYADLSDYFFVWLKRMLPHHPLLSDPSDVANPLTPKVAEIVQNEAVKLSGRVKDRAFFEDAMARAFREGRRILQDDGIGAVVFAHKTTEGWEALLSGLIRGGWVVTASWPITTERSGRPRAHESAALSASVHLIIRPRAEDAPVGDWTDVVRDLPRRVGDWMKRLQTEGIRGADLVFACIGPALEIFSRYSRVEAADGREVALADYLAKVWEVVGRSALEQVLGTTHGEPRGGDGVALEEDARLTALFLWTVQSTGTAVQGVGEMNGEESEEIDDSARNGVRGGKEGGYILSYDIVRRFAQPLGIHLEDWERRIIETEKGAVKLLAISGRAAQLFGGKAPDVVVAQAKRIQRGSLQSKLYQEPAPPASRKPTDGQKAARVLPAPRETTTLDRVHMAMLLQEAGQAGELREFLSDEVRHGPSFLHLANALSALYPSGSEEKRLIDAVLLAAPGR